MQRRPLVIDLERNDLHLQRLPRPLSLGRFLRELRESRGFSINRLAVRSGLAKSTLSKWEAGCSQPRLPELDATLAALGATPAQRQHALSLIQAPRAVQQARKEAEAATSEAWEELGLLPAGGDLLRAIRHRRGLSQEQVAAHLCVHPTTVCYWEQSRTTPPADRLDELFTLLRAHPEERAALADGRLFLVPPLQETAPTLEALEQMLVALDARAHGGERAGLDLGFLALEARHSHDWRHASASSGTSCYGR